MGFARSVATNKTQMVSVFYFCPRDTIITPRMRKALIAIRHCSLSMKFMFYIVLLILFGSCSFPEKAFMKQVEAAKSNLMSLNSAIITSYSNGIRYTRDLPNDSLRRNLNDLQIESFEVLDSLSGSMVLTWNKSRQNELIQYSLYYRREPRLPDCFNCTKVRKLNDSMWVQKYSSPIVID
jgi:hypothetical protein